MGEHIEVTFEGCAATRFLAFAPADETRTKGAALVGFVPNSDGSKSLLEQQVLELISSIVDTCLRWLTYAYLAGIYLPGDGNSADEQQYCV